MRTEGKRHNKFLEKDKRKVKVCGEDFENTEDKLSELFQHIDNEIPVDSLPDIDLSNIAKLTEMKKKKAKNGGGKRKPGGKPGGRPSEKMKNLVGLAGEIHAFRILRKKYGPTVVNSSSWISANSIHKFPGNQVDDSFGCDFKIQHQKRTYFIEVKATQGDEEVFELGLSEIRKAIEVANKRREKFVILHITKALSKEPEFSFLPNPYDKKHMKSYRISNAGLRIQYQHENTSS